MSVKRIRVLVGKPGLDGHDRGAKVVAAALRDAGMEVIYTGLHQTPDQIVEAALHEDVDVVALSVLSGAHMTLFPEILALMQQRGIGDRLLTGGGIIPNEDMVTLAERGVGKLFGPGTNTQEIIEYIRDWYVDVHGREALPPLEERREPAPPEPLPARIEPATRAATATRTTTATRSAPRARARKVTKPARATPVRRNGAAPAKAGRVKNRKAAKPKRTVARAQAGRAKAGRAKAGRTKSGRR